MIGLESGDSDEGQAAGGPSFLKEMLASIPGIDEATSFGEVMNSLDKYNFDLIIFDTAPTGHTLRLLNFPQILEKALLKLIQLKEKFGGMLMQMQTLMAGGGTSASDFEDAQKKLF